MLTPGTTVSVSGNLSDNGNSGVIDGTLDVSGDATVLRDMIIEVSGELEVSGYLTLSSGGYTTTNNGTIDCDGTFDATGGTIAQGSAGNIEISVAVSCFGSLDAAEGTVTFDGGTAFPTDDYYNVAITSGTHSLAGNCTVAGSFTLSSGAISINSETLDVEGTFNASGGSVTFTGSGRLQLGGSVSSLGTFT